MQHLAVMFSSIIHSKGRFGILKAQHALKCKTSRTQPARKAPPALRGFDKNTAHSSVSCDSIPAPIQEENVTPLAPKRISFFSLPSSLPPAPLL